MIHRFEVKNFRSILDLGVAFTYDEGKAPPKDDMVETLPFLEDSKGRRVSRVVPVLSIYGANASGKSNLVRAFQIFQRILSFGIVGAYQPNKLNHGRDKSIFRVEVLLSDGKYATYEIGYNGQRIVEERLSWRDCHLGEGSNERTLFCMSGEGGGDNEKASYCSAEFLGLETAEYSAKRFREAIRIECSDPDGNQVRPFFWCLVRSFSGLSPLVVNVWKEVFERLHVFSMNSFFISEGIDRLAGADTDEARQKALDKIGVLLQKFDFGIKNLSLLRQKMQEEPTDNALMGAICCRRGREVIVDQITSRHLDVNGEVVPFNFMLEESDGTKVIAGILGICLWALETGRTVVIDELDRSLHPFVLVSLVKLFKSRRYNVANGQLIFTLHDPTLLGEEMMRVSEVAIINKTLKEGSTCRRLSDYKGVRNINNFRKQYLAGVYSGIPFPYI